LFLATGPGSDRAPGRLCTGSCRGRALILTDSGGFQVFSLSALRKITEHGILFRSHLNGDLHTFTPESTVDAQLAFGSDILMALDECPSIRSAHEYARESMERTVRWARQGGRPLSAKAGQPGSIPCVAGPFVSIVQGSMFADLRRGMRRAWLNWMPRAMPSAVFGRRTAPPSLRWSRRRSPFSSRSASLYNGVGLPEELRSTWRAGGHDGLRSSPRNARNGCLFTSQGRVIIKHAKYKDDNRPVDERCSCYTCRTYSRAYLRHLFQAGEMLYSMLATRHNIRRYLDIMCEIRHAILLGSFPEYMRGVRATASALE
jgi:queuine tRNA-ribosyltransferase